MSDTGAWGIVLQAGHWDHGGWSTDSRDGLVVCACGETLSEPETAVKP